MHEGTTREVERKALISAAVLGVLHGILDYAIYYLAPHTLQIVLTNPIALSRAIFDVLTSPISIYVLLALIAIRAMTSVLELLNRVAGFSLNLVVSIVLFSYMLHVLNFGSLEIKYLRVNSAVVSGTIDITPLIAIVFVLFILHILSEVISLLTEI